VPYQLPDLVSCLDGLSYGHLGFRNLEAQVLNATMVEPMHKIKKLRAAICAAEKANEKSILAPTNPIPASKVARMATNFESLISFTALHPRRFYLELVSIGRSVQTLWVGRI
jgi:hypothetical protein